MSMYIFLPIKQESSSLPVLPHIIIVRKCDITDTGVLYKL